MLKVDVKGRPVFDNFMLRSPSRTGLGTVRTLSPSGLHDSREGLRHTLQGYPQGGITGVFGAMVGPYATKEATKESFSRNHESHVLNLTSFLENEKANSPKGCIDNHRLV